MYNLQRLQSNSGIICKNLILKTQESHINSSYFILKSQEIKSIAFKHLTVPPKLQIFERKKKLTK